MIIKASEQSNFSTNLSADSKKLHLLL